MGGTTPVAHGGDPQDRTGSPRPRCIATPCSLLPKTQEFIPYPIEKCYQCSMRVPKTLRNSASHWG
ncbi:hypothetical protein BJP36_43520 [Moorena producens JHB]|uniref:Uncharacterized protein n=1 Tax=Moorena producens (strain JHB) TaxID=1454205 RepID=A0A9Q9ST93_MOOP1|nr:hypothetical protein [Moorena producens]WAN69233.1 hypothetical protein BJP36_43520 [Moorena producens JHB]